jgi:hypothetical protein
MRIDVDDLVALAVALDVSVTSLLLPAPADSATTVFLTPNHALPALQAWRWLTDRPNEPAPKDDGGRSSSSSTARGRLPPGDIEALARLGVPTRFATGRGPRLSHFRGLDRVCGRSSAVRGESLDPRRG